MALALALVGIGVAAYVHGLELERAAAQEAAQQTGEEQPEDPFAHIPRELPPGVASLPTDDSGTSKDPGSAPTPVDPGDIEDPRWLEALKEGAAGELLAAEARKAKAKDDHALFREKGKAAKLAFDRAFTLTVELEAELIEAHGEHHPTVVRVVRVRNGWQDQMRVFHRI